MLLYLYTFLYYLKGMSYLSTANTTEKENKNKGIEKYEQDCFSAFHKIFYLDYLF